jgi:hypothetical protein
LKRIEGGGDPEEIWFSKFMIGSCYDELGQMDKALHWYLESYEMYPDRPDPIHKMVTRFRLSGKNDIALLFAEYGSLVYRTQEGFVNTECGITRPLDQNIFSCPPLRDYHFEEEISITAYYTPYKENGFFAASSLSLRKNVPYWVKDQNARNLIYYVHTLKDEKFIPLDIQMPNIQEGGVERYHPTNPSIVKTTTGYKLICKAVNYTQTGGKAYQTSDPDGIFRTKNFLVHLDPDFKVISQREIVENLPRDKIPAFNVEGFEDCRLFEWNGDDWFTCTTPDTNPTGSRQISLCKLSSHRAGVVERLIPLKGSDPYRSEKNWLPFVQGGQMQIVYSYDPFTILTPQLETGECETKFIFESPQDFSRFRGSASPIPFDGGYLMLTHEIAYYADYTRSYLHRFVILDPQLRIQKISLPFAFLKKDIESCFGMTIDHSGKELILSVGIQQKEAILCSVPIESLKQLFNL